MKIELPNGEREFLDENLSLEEKFKKVNELTARWSEVIYSKWKEDSVRYFLDGLANYIVWHKDEQSKNKQDKDVLSEWSLDQINGKRKSHSIPYPDLSNGFNSFGSRGDENV